MYYYLYMLRWKLPFKYLGVPVHNKRLRNSDWKDVENKVENKLYSWRGFFDGVA
jgi:hypothetical protein